MRTGLVPTLLILSLFLSAPVPRGAVASSFSQFKMTCPRCGSTGHLSAYHDNHDRARRGDSQPSYNPPPRPRETAGERKKREAAIANAAGLRQFQREDWEGAIKTFQKALLLDPGDSRIRSNLQNARKARGRAAEMLKQREDAVAVARMQGEIQVLADSLHWVEVEQGLPEGFSEENPYAPQKPVRTPPEKSSKIKPEKPVKSGKVKSIEEVLKPAFTLLEKSAEGKEILSFLTTFKVRFEYSWALGPDSGAAFDADERVILLPPDAEDRNPVSLAVSIGHEGHHAVQAIAKKMEPSIEAEQGASFRDRVIYHEMIQAGAQRLPKGNVTEENFRRFAEQVKKQQFIEFEEDITKLYQKAREPALERASGGWSVLRWALETVDSDFLHNKETLDEQSGKIWNLLRHWDIKRTRKQREIEREWEKKWMQQNQKRFKRLYE